MKRVFLIASLIISTGASAQQSAPPQADMPTVISNYRQLLIEANDRLAAVAGQNATLAKQLEETKKAAAPKELEKK